MDYVDNNISIFFLWQKKRLSTSNGNLGHTIHSVPLSLPLHLYAFGFEANEKEVSDVAIGYIDLDLIVVKILLIII